MKWKSLLLLGIAIFSFSEVNAEPFEPFSFPSMMSALSITTPLEFCGEPVPLEVQEVRERIEKELLLSLWRRPQVILWLKRSRRYMPYIEEAVKKRRDA